jgi:hypothetical protein
MPTDPPSFPARPGSRPPAGPVPARRYGDDASGIRRQAREIINAVLSDPAPEQAGIRDQLREHLAAHPGNPEKALAEHLRSLRPLTGSPAGAPGCRGSRRADPDGPERQAAADRLPADLQSLHRRHRRGRSVHPVRQRRERHRRLVHRRHRGAAGKRT